MVRCLTKLSMHLNPSPPPPLPPPPPQNQCLHTPIPRLSRQARAPLLRRQQNYKSGLTNVRNAHWGGQKETNGLCSADVGIPEIFYCYISQNLLKWIIKGPLWDKVTN